MIPPSLKNYVPEWAKGLNRPYALTIAGSDSGGGAGIQQDIRVLGALDVFASSVITALTAQNSRGVKAVMAVDPDFVRAQLQAVMDDIEPRFIKTGMLVNEAVTATVIGILAGHPGIVLVVDTVMLSKNGKVLLDNEGVQAMRLMLFPQAALITPNIPEAEALTGLKIKSIEEMETAAKRLHEESAGAAVLVKGGHLPGPETVDCLVHEGKTKHFSSKRIDTPHTHGTGCTLSSAITALLAHGIPLEDACEKGIALTRKAIENAYPMGGGTGVLDISCWKETDIVQAIQRGNDA